MTTLLKFLAAEIVKRYQKSWLEKIWNFIVLDVIGKINWKAASLSADDQNYIHNMLEHDHYVILTRRNNHLSTFFVGLGSLLATGKWSFWGHSLMNLEDDVSKTEDFRLIEALGTGTQYTPFDKVFNVQHVALLTPKTLTVAEWTEVMSKAREQLGKKYDTLFDLKDETKINCVELVRLALMSIPDYKTRFAHFEATIAKKKYLTPQMFYDCEDFQVVYEVHLK